MLKAGYHRVDITPEVGVPMAGFDLRKACFTDVHDPVFCSMAVLEQEGEVFVLGSFDLLGVTDEMVSGIRERICRQMPVKAEHITLGAIHTHAAPQSIFPSFSCYDKTYVANVMDAAAEAAVLAYEMRYPVTAYFAHTTVNGVACYRDRTREQSSYAMPCDTLYLQGTENKRSICITVFACHPTVLNEQNLNISRDLVYGCESAFIKGHPQTDMLFYNGACGDVSTRYTRKTSDHAEAERLGAIWADALTDSLSAAKPLTGKLCAGQTSLFVPSASFFTKEQRQEILPYLEQKIAACQDAAQKREYIACRSVLQRIHYGKGKGCDAILGVLAFGDILFCTLPFEYASVDADVLKAQIKAHAGKQAIICGYCNGYEGYLPSGRPLDKDSGYEDMASGFRYDAKELVAKAILSMASEVAL